MVQRILLKGWHLNGKEVMKKAVMAMIMGVTLLTLSSCGQAKDADDTQTNVLGSTAESGDSTAESGDSTAESGDSTAESGNSTAESGGSTAEPGSSTGEVQKTQKDNIAGSDLAELDRLTGEYEYLSDYGTGKLRIQKSSSGYDISDYESETSCRFLADSSNIETIENNRIYVKYPEQVFSDDTANYGYYVLEYSTDEINVYYGESGFEDTQLLYRATKKIEMRADVYEYEGEYNSYDVNEPALEIKKNDDETYQIQIDLFRLWGFYDGAGKITEDGLEFTATGPRGNEMNGVIKLEEDIAVVTIFGQEWLDFAGLSEYRFYKTSDVPNMDDLLDSFINGLTDAVDSEDSTLTFSVSDLNMDSEEWDAYSIGEKVDLDNDGENELIINGPYGGIYLDARDGRVYEFAAGEGTVLILSYTYYNGAVWIMYSNRSSAGFDFYHMEKFEGADNLTAEMYFGEEFDPDNAETGIKYTLNGAEISCDEYTELCSKIFAAEVNTN